MKNTALLLAFALALSACSRQPAGQTTGPAVQQGQGAAPEFELANVAGGKMSSADIKGKVAVIDFWATWCGPCVEELPTLQRILDRHGDAVAVVGVNLDERDLMDAEALRGWIASRNVPGVQVADGLGWESDLVQAFGVREIPFSVVVDATGRVIAVGRHGKELEKTVRAALAGG